MARARWPSGARLLLLWLWLWAAAADVPYGGEECAGIVDFPLKDGTNFTAVDAQVRSLLTNRELWPVWMPEKCHAANRRRVCLINYDDHSAEDKQMCKSTCDKAVKDCGDFLDLAQKATGIDVEQALKVQCTVLPTENCLSGGTATAEHEDDTIECPYPLVVPDESSRKHFVKNIVGTGCALPCPTMLMPEDERVLSKDITLLLLLLGSVGSAITAFFYKKRQTTSMNLVAATAVVSFLCSVTTLAYVAADFNDEVTCAGNSGYVIRGTFCVTQAAIFMFCFLEFQYLNLFAIFQLWAALMMTIPKSTLDTLRAWYIPVSTGVIIASVASMYSQDALGFEWGVPRPFCFYIRHTDERLDNEPSSILFWVFIYGPTAFATFLTFCLTIHALYRVNRVLQQSEQLSARTVTERMSTSGGSSRRNSLSTVGGLKKRLQYNHRTFKFLVIFVLSSLVYLPLMYYLLEFKEEDYQNSMVEMVRCLLVNSMEGGDSADHAHHICGENPEDRPDIWMYQYVCFYLTAFGICVFLVYGASGQITRAITKIATGITTDKSRSRSPPVSTENPNSSGRMSPRANRSPRPPRPQQPRNHSPPPSSNTEEFFGRDSAL